ncbi:MAG: aminopeptidase [Spirochaetaceae bacterium]|jgi:leucyl aminopeptidase (aminopeptidase T)|nr:aminopeptidase [Spirochaetaceae bacterium]
MATVSNLEGTRLASALFAGKPDASLAAQLQVSAEIAIKTSLKVQKDEQVLIISNPASVQLAISAALYDAAAAAGGKPVLLIQNTKSQVDFAEPAVIAAFGSEPEVVISISAGKLGKDERGIAHPYPFEGKGYDHIFHLLQYGKKSTRGFWSPSITLDTFIRTVPIDYALLQERCAAIAAILSEAESVRVSAPGGTDIRLGLRGRAAKSDDGDFSKGGAGGNLPAGEVFISPENNTAEGVIVFDGAISVNEGDIVIAEPIVCEVHGGFVSEVRGGAEAEALKATIRLAERNAWDFEKSGKLPRGMASVYARNAKNIGELGIGLNPAARITGNMLEDEKVYKTCHFAIGQNYDEDAPALIHLDGLVNNPTITAFLPCGTETLIEKAGELSQSLLS